MRTTGTFGLLALLATIGSGIAACSGGGLTTASLLQGGGGTASSAAPGAPAPEDPMARTLQVASTSARAVKCGFYFDPQRLRTNFLAAEAQRLPPDQYQKAEKGYDFTRQKVTETLGDADAYCTDARAGTIKADLQRHLAGDYTATVKVQAVTSLAVPKSEQRPMNRDAVFDPEGPRPKQ
jgi:hypothetical protein